MTEIPRLLADFVNAINRGDTPAFLDFFTADGVVDDWHRRFEGRTAIQQWSDAETIGAHGTLTITEVISADATEIVADTFWRSEAFSGPGRFRFTLEAGKIKELKISEA
jgi:hypothetical protein